MDAPGRPGPRPRVVPLRTPAPDVPVVIWVIDRPDHWLAPAPGVWVAPPLVVPPPPLWALPDEALPLWLPVEPLCMVPLVLPCVPVVLPCGVPGVLLPDVPLPLWPPFVPPAPDEAEPPSPAPPGCIESAASGSVWPGTGRPKVDGEGVIADDDEGRA